MLKRFLTPHERRMRAAIVTSAAPDPIAAAAFERRAQMDLHLRAELKRLDEGISLLHFCRMSDGSGFRMSRILRQFFQDYLGRITRGGPWLLPTSFNVLEAFLRFSREYRVFDMREEEEHLLRAYDFLNWYTAEAGALIQDPSVLKGILTEGVVFSYDMVGAPGDFLISTPESRIALLGISLIRHDDELSVMLLAGENPPYPNDQDAVELMASSKAYPGKETVEPSPDLTAKDRLVSGLPDYGQVLLLTRIYLDSRRYDVRYVHMDTGPSYLTYTDDPAALGIHRKDRPWRESLAEHLRRYDDLFSALTALIYLPIYFTVHGPSVVRTRFATGLKARKNSPKIRRALRALGKESGVPIKELYQLFPKGPAKLAAKIGGIPKPKGCI